MRTDTAGEPPRGRDVPSVRHTLLRNIVLTVAVTFAVVSALSVSLRAAHAALPAATFTWSMEKRFGPDRNLDLLASDPHNTNPSANPATHNVTFNSCTLSNALTLTYRWTIDGVATELPNPVCLLTKALTRGNHTVTLTLSDGRFVRQTVRVRDIVIVSMGDSAGAGEGSPDVPASIAGPARWQNRRCHRSSKAASALTAKALEDADPHSSVTFVHVACSGARIMGGGILDPYAGIEPPAGSPSLPSQVSRARAILGNRAIDALLIQVGANDLEFGQIVVKCMIQQRCDLAASPATLDPALGSIVGTGLGACSALPFAVTECRAFMNALGNGVAGESAASLFSSRIEPLRESFAALSAILAMPRAADGGGGLGVPDNRVFVNQYFDPTRGSDGLTCNPAANGVNLFRTLPGFVLAETTFTTNTVVPTLNAEIASATTTHSWRPVTGMAADFSTRGYCSSNRLVNRLDDSFLTQLNENATIHPNPAGYARISTRMIPVVRTSLGI